MERVLAQKATVGAVTALEGHVIEIAFEDQTLQIAAARYWLFMELMSDASRQLARQRFRCSPGAAPGSGQARAQHSAEVVQ